MKHDLEANKRNALAFYRTAYLGDPAKAVDLYVGAEYIQHNPLVGDGKAAFIAYFEEMARDYPEKDIKFVRTVAEDDLVALHACSRLRKRTAVPTPLLLEIEAMAAL